jgi:hypothetical protein
MAGSSDSLVNSSEVDPVRSGGGGWKRELGNEVEYDGVLAGAVKLTLQVELDDFYIAHGHADVFVPQHLHERRQADPETHHFCCEGVPQPVWIYPAGAPRSPGSFG